MKKLSLILITLCFTVIPSFAIEEIKDNDVLNLDQCIEIALKNSPEIRKAQSRVKIAKASKGQAVSAWTPAIGAGIGYDGYHSRRHHKTTYENSMGINAGISQMIYDFGKTNAEINSRKFQVTAAEFELEQMILETSLAVKRAYYALLAAYANNDVQVQNVEINERNYEQTKAFFDEGVKSRIDFINAEVNLSKAKISLLEAHDAYHEATINLNQALYLTHPPKYSIARLQKFNPSVVLEPVPAVHDIDSEHEHDTSHHHEELQEKEIEEISLTGIIKESEIVATHNIEKFDKTFEEVLKIANEQRPDLKTYLALKESAKESLKAAKRSWLPELSASANYSFSKSEAEYGANTVSYGAELQIPMLRPLSVKSEIDIAKAELEDTEDDIILAYQNVYFDVESALCDTKIYENEIPLTLDKIRLAKEEFELAEGRYLEGIGNYIELQDARSNYLSAQQEYINTVYNYGIARAELDFAMGLK